MTILTDKELAFLQANRAAAMITVGKDGWPKPARIVFQVVDGKIWSSGTRNRVRTKRVLKDPRVTLYVHEPTFNFLALEANVTVLDDETTLDDSVKYFTQLGGGAPFKLNGKEFADEASFRDFLVEQERILYQFEPVRFWGTY